MMTLDIVLAENASYKSIGVLLSTPLEKLKEIVLRHPVITRSCTHARLSREYLSDAPCQFNNLFHNTLVFIILHFLESKCVTVLCEKLICLVIAVAMLSNCLGTESVVACCSL